MNKKCLSAEWVKREFERKFGYQESTVLKTAVKSFVLKSPEGWGKLAINRVLSQQLHNFMQKNIDTLLPQSIRGYIYAQNNNFPFHPYESYLVYTITFNKNCLLSFYYDEYIYTGGAHGNTTRFAKTFNLIKGNNIPLSAFFNKNTNYTEALIRSITKQAEQRYQENPGFLFEDYKELIKKNFNENSFYLTKDGLVIYYGQYEIAPYSSGIVEFVIPYTELEIPPTCEKWC